jgi:hypothetical protein
MGCTLRISPGEGHRSSVRGKLEASNFAMKTRSMAGIHRITAESGAVPEITCDFSWADKHLSVRTRE